jgi:ATP-dependent phosphofructokinase / diphosphate-dependent phosphofructokinase
MRIGILTAGGDCPGINAAIRGVGKSAILEYGMDVIGISNGFLGLLVKDFIELDDKNLSGILQLGGTILGTSREKPFKAKANFFDKLDKPDIIKKNYKSLGLDCLVCIGGNGTIKTASQLSELGLNIIGIPKTIDNDVWGTDQTFGFDSAVGIATEALDRLHTTANSHKRIMVMEVMGHHTGWLALYTGLAGGADVILIPEIDYDINTICEYLDERAKKGKPYSIVVVAEGIDIPSKEEKKGSVAGYISRAITKKTGFETREIVLGYVQRGGTPSPMDRILATQFGAFATKLIASSNFGNMVALINNEITSTAISDSAGRIKLVPDDFHLVEKARTIGTCFGDNFFNHLTKN